ncbi:MAG TPA: DUF4410 domain-containing protein [Terriglobales bacterium]|nr:DUF4410 domain-containing protein [Terriglobales bacterium]
MKPGIVICLLFLFSMVAKAQTAAQQPMADDDVVTMVKAGISAQIIIEKIKSSSTAFDTSPKKLAELKSDGVSDDVLLAMVTTTASPAAGKEDVPSSGNSKSSTVQRQANDSQSKEKIGKPVLVVDAFTTTPGMPFPYDLKQLQLQTITELKVKRGADFDVTADSNSAGAKAAAIYKLNGEVLSWHSGNRATRVLVGMGSGRETAKIHYWLTDENGKKVFEHTDTIRAAFWGNAYAGSVGQLAQPFADKIADRLKEAKLM